MNKNPDREFSGSKIKTATIWTVVLISVVYFGVFCIPNSKASADIAMVGVFEPDEGMPLPYVFDMIKPADSLLDAAHHFVAYQYYFYGFPFFAYSALSILPAKLFGDLAVHVPLVMTLLRQLNSVLLLMLSSILLVYMQTGFKSFFKSILLLLFMLAVPGAVMNNFWWHPDGLSILFITLTIFFLWKDDLSFGKFFYWTALVCGVSAGIKQNGVFFFLAIAVYLLWGLFSKRITFKQVILRGAAFLGIMFGGFVLSNPMLLLPGPRQRYFEILALNRLEVTTGYNVFYAKGLAAATPTLSEYYGTWLFLGLACLAPVIAIMQNRKRLLNVIILCWALMMGGYVFFFSLVKFQYVLAFALPLFSSLWVYFPDFPALKEGIQARTAKKIIWPTLTVLVSLVFIFQFVSYIRWDVSKFVTQTHRAENNPSLQFYDKLEQQLAPLIEQPLRVYRDVGLYVPDSSSWEIFYTFDLLDYATFQETNPQVILLMQQRLNDYLNPAVVGIDPNQLEISREFYRDADNGNLEGYTLAFRDGFGLAFVRDDIYHQYFSETP